jgi:hypothetical protein
MIVRPSLDAWLAGAIPNVLVRAIVRHAIEGAVTHAQSHVTAARRDCAHPRAVALFSNRAGGAVRVCPTCARLLIEATKSPS